MSYAVIIYEVSHASSPSNTSRPKIVIQPRSVERAARLQRKSLASLARAAVPAPSSITANPIERSAIQSTDKRIANESAEETTARRVEEITSVSGDIRGSGRWHKVASTSPLSEPPISRNSDQPPPPREQPPCVECSKRDPSAPKCNFCKLLCLMDK